MSDNNIVSARKAVVILLAVVLTIGGVGWGYRHFGEYQENRKEEARIKAELDAKAILEAALKEYEDILNSFVKDVAAEVKAYKLSRMVLKEMVKPHNYVNPEYAKVNYLEYKNNIQPLLLKQSQKVLSIFDLSGAKLDAALDDKPEDTRLFIRTKWLAMRDNEYRNYQAYFDADAKLLKAYEELFRFYYVKSKKYQIVNDAFVFSDPSDQAAELELQKIIASMQKPDADVPKAAKVLKNVDELSNDKASSGIPSNVVDALKEKASKEQKVSSDANAPVAEKQDAPAVDKTTPEQGQETIKPPVE